MSPTERTPLEASVHIDALPDEVWRVVSDVRRTGKWSPECRKVMVWGRGPVRRGTRITGINRRRLMVWPTTSRVHLYDEGRAIGWTVFENRARWSYELEREGEGTRLTERRETPNGMTRFATVFADALLGGADGHSDELLEGMQTSLERIKALVEA